MTFSGDANVFAVPGSVDKTVLTGTFTQPVKADIEALQRGETITVDLPPALTTDIDSIAKLLVRTSGGTKSLDLGTLSAALTSIGKPFLSAADLGLVGDSNTDDAPALQRACDTWGAAGGATFWLRARPGESFFFKGTIRGGNNVSILFASPHTVTKTSRVTLAGSLARVTNADRFRLLADTAAGDSFLTVDTSPHGGGLVSTKFVVGQTIRITGLRDSCGTALEGQELRITGLVDGSSRVNVTPALAFGFKAAYPLGDFELNQGTVNVSLVGIVQMTAATGNVAAGANLWPIANPDIGIFTPGDLALVIDEKKASDIAGVDTTAINMEIREIIAPVAGDASNSLRLGGRLERDYTTARFARLLKINPIINASIQGATVFFTQAPDIGQVTHCFEIAYGSDCFMLGVAVPNSDVYGTRGQSFRIFRSLSCRVDNSTAQDAKYFGVFEGHGLQFEQSTDCSGSGNLFRGMRHGARYVTATNCYDVNTVVENPRHLPIHFAGLNEYGCRSVNPQMSGSTSFQESAGRAPPVVYFGAGGAAAGAHRCGLDGGRVVGFKADDGAHVPCVWFLSGSNGCWVRGTEFHDVGAWLEHRDTPGLGALISSGHRIESVSVDGCSGTLIGLAGRVNGASLNTLQDLAINGSVFRNIGRMIDASFITELQIYDCELDEITIDAANPFFVAADSCPDLYVARNTVKGARSGLRVSNCANFRVIDNEFADMSGGTLTLFDNAGNTGIWQDNRTPGYTPTMTRSGASVLEEYSRAAGVVTMADNSAFNFKPARPAGIVQVWSNGTSTLYAIASYIAQGTADCDLMTPSSNTANAAVTTGILTGTTGTAGKFTIAPRNNGTIYFENRLGSSQTIDFATN